MKNARWLAAVVLVALGCVLTPVALAGTWARSQVLHADRFVETTAPLARDSAVRASLSDRLAVNVKALADRLLPDVVPDELIDNVSEQVVASEQFEAVWDGLMRLAHPQLRQVLLGDQDEAVVGATDGKVTVDLRAAAVLALERAFGEGGRIPAAVSSLGAGPAADVDWDVTVFQSEDLVRVQTASRVANDIVVPLAFVAGIALILALIVAPNRAKTVKWIGIGWLVCAVAVGVMLAFARIRYVAVLDAEVPEATAKRTYDILASTLVDRVRILFLVGLALTSIAVLISPWRAWRAGETRQPGSVMSWLRGHRGDVAWTVLAAGLGVLVWWNEPTTLVTTVVVSAAVAAAGLAALMGRGAHPAPLPG